MRVDTEDGGHRFAACVGSYGYMGDLMALSERMRWLGPARYGLAGALTLLRGRAYGAAVSLLPAAPPRCVADKADSWEPHSTLVIARCMLLCTSL